MIARWILAVSALAVALCVSHAQASSKSSTKPRITITRPQNGATIYGSTVTVHVAVSDFKLVPPVLRPPSDWHKIPLLKGNRGHIHYLLDGLGNLVLTRDVVVGTSHTWTNVMPGKHTITAYLSTSQHGPFPGAAPATIKVIVRPGRPTTSPPAKHTAAPAPSIAVADNQVTQAGHTVTLRIQVRVSNFKLVAPVFKNPPMLRGNEGHIHYALDSMSEFVASKGATTALSHGWAHISPGRHTVIVYLATSQHQLFPGTQPVHVGVVIPRGASTLYVTNLPPTGGAAAPAAHWGTPWDDALSALLAGIGILLVAAALVLWRRPSTR